MKKKEDDSLYESIFSLIVKDSVEFILRREVANLKLQLSLFWNNISWRILTDETLTNDMPLNVLDVPKGFFEAWRVWKEQAQNENQEELSYQALKALILKQDN